MISGIKIFYTCCIFLQQFVNNVYFFPGFSDPLDEPGSGVDPSVDTVPGAASNHESSAEPTSGGDSAPPSPTGSPLPKKRKRKEKVL